MMLAVSVMSHDISYGRFRGYIVPEASYHFVAEIACSGRKPLAKQRVLSDNPLSAKQFVARLRVARPNRNNRASWGHESSKNKQARLQLLFIN